MAVNHGVAGSNPAETDTLLFTIVRLTLELNLELYSKKKCKIANCGSSTFAPIVQLEECGTSNPKAAGSSPAGGELFIQNFYIRILIV